MTYHFTRLEVQQWLSRVFWNERRLGIDVILMLANQMPHQFYPHVITIEEVGQILQKYYAAQTRLRQYVEQCGV